MRPMVICKVCDTGAIWPAKRYRMSGPVVVIGYVILVPCILGIVYSVLMLVWIVIGTSTITLAKTPELKEPSRELMAEHEVPADIVEKVLALEPIPEADFRRLSTSQLSAVEIAQTSLAGANATVAAAGMVVGGFSICTGISSFVAGLLGWLLIMKKKVLLCSSCGAVTPA